VGPTARAEAGDDRHPLLAEELEQLPVAEDDLIAAAHTANAILPHRLVDVAIINWNTSPAAIGAAESFAASQGIEARVTVVDNRSADEQRQMLSERAGSPGFELLLPERNLGFGAAANLALRDGSSPLVCVSNADVVPAPAALAELAAVARETPDAGMVGPVFAGGTQHYHAPLPSRAALLARTFVGSAGSRRAPSPPPGRIAQVGQVSGACFVMRREIWEESGGFDEGYFLWYEDVDLAKRLVDRGRRNLVVGSARVEHGGASSFVQVEPRTAQAIRLRSLGRYIEVHDPQLMPLARPLLWASGVLRARGAPVSPGDVDRRSGL
jgi:N-acetylglucosaminyl-diphospho-decaprenol L-rhamnosyltransferase